MWLTAMLLLSSCQDEGETPAASISGLSMPAQPQHEGPDVSNLPRPGALTLESYFPTPTPPPRRGVSAADAGGGSESSTQKFTPQLFIQPPPASGQLAAIAALFARYPSSPLLGQEAMLVQVASEFGIDWRLLPAIAVHESGAGVNACGFNAWGYDSCGVTFASWEQGARTCAALLVALGAQMNEHEALREWQGGGNYARLPETLSAALSYDARVSDTIEGMR